MVRSWIKQTTVLLLTILLSLSLFITWTNYNFNTQIRKTANRENTNTVSTWCKTVEVRLDALHENLYDLLLTIYNNTELKRGTPMMQFEARQSCIDEMSDKLIASEMAEAFFVRDDESLFLFCSKSGIPNREASAMKAFALEQTFEQTTGIWEKSWRLATIDEQDYFVKTIALGKYMVGAISKLSQYDIQKSFNVLGEEMSLMLEQKDTEALYLCSGQDWRQEMQSEKGVRFFQDERMVVEIPFEDENIAAILAVRSDTLLENAGYGSAGVLLICSLICLGLIVYLLIFLNHQVLKPTKVLLKANQEIGSGNFSYQITAPAHNREFAELYESYNNMAARICRLNQEAYDHLRQQQENQLRLFRAQIKPHFYLNAITTIVNMTYQDKPEKIRTYISGLAKYLRYMLNTQARWTTVAEEVTHIRNYLKMQELRFPGSIIEDIQYDDDVAHTPIPMLALFTLVENSIKHAMTLYEPLKLTIRCTRFETEGFVGTRIVEEDSGDGFPQEVLDMIGGEKPPAMTKEHLGLSNLSYTLNLIYHRGDLLRIGNRPEGGARAEIWIPEGEIEDEAIDL